MSLFCILGLSLSALAQPSQEITSISLKKSITKKGITQSPYTRLLFAGDAHFHWRVKELQQKHSLIFPIQTLRSLFLKSDYRILNLETTLSLEGLPFNKKSYIFSSDKKNVQLLKFLNINTAILGNNHSLDMGAQGLKNTMLELRNARINTVGAGQNYNEATSPLYFTVNDIRFSMLSFSSIGEMMTFSGNSKAGVARPSLDIIHTQIKEMKKYSDVILVSLHWGIEYYVHPTKKQINLAHKIIDMGATAIIGHHPHIPQGLEKYKDGFIAYSLGNFLFGSVNSRQNHNMLLKLNFYKKTKQLHSVSIYPILGRYRDAKDEGIRQLRAKETIGFWKDLIVQSNKLNSTAHHRIKITNDGTGEFLIHKTLP